jgi:hypothetical protein
MFGPRRKAEQTKTLRKSRHKAYMEQMRNACKSVDTKRKGRGDSEEQDVAARIILK